MYKLAICDDDTETVSALEKFLHTFFAERGMSYSAASFSDIESLHSSMNAGTDYDLIILDILFDTDNGMSYAKRLRGQGSETDIIFITISAEYAVESYDAGPLYFIVKPVNDEKMTAALERFLKKNAPDYICLNTPNSLIKIKLSDILYFEIYGHRVIIHKSDGTQFGFRGTLREIENQLPPSMFMRPHRSYLVNVTSISEITHYSLKLINGEQLPISKAMYNKIQYDFVDYLDKNDVLI